MRRLRIGVNALHVVRDSGGGGTYAFELLRELAADSSLEVTAFVSREFPRERITEPAFHAVRWVHVPVPVLGGGAANVPLRMAGQWVLLPLLALRHRLDVLHGLANVSPPLHPGVAAVVTVPDVIWMRFPGTMTPRATTGFKLVTPPAVRAAERVITLSHAAKGDLVELLRVPPDKIDVIHLGVRQPGGVPATPEGELRRRFAIGDRPVILCVAPKREHKNLAGLLSAVSHLRDQTAVVALLGATTEHERHLRDEAQRLGVAERVLFLPWLPDADLEGLYAIARCCVLPSFAEGFGLPVIEAMARQVPVAASNTSALPEVAGGAALLFDPHDPTEIAARIDALLDDDDIRGSVRARGLDRARALTWEATARATVAVYRRAAAQRRSGR